MMHLSLHVIVSSADVRMPGLRGSGSGKARSSAMRAVHDVPHCPAKRVRALSHDGMKRMVSR